MSPARSSMTPTFVMPPMTLNSPIKRSTISISRFLKECLRPTVSLWIRSSPMTVITAPVMQIYPLIRSGVFGMKDAMMSARTYAIIMNEGNRSLTLVRSSDETGAFSFLNMNIMMGMVKNAPSSVAKNIPGLPCITKKSAKFIFAAPASIMEVVSPTRVAAP